jgi:uncharacterized protein (TIGR02246 family)
MTALLAAPFTCSRSRVTATLLVGLLAGCASRDTRGADVATLQPAPCREEEAPIVDEAAAVAAITSLLDQWHAAAAASDEERYFALMSADSVFLGTDATERWSREEFRTYAHPHFEKKKGWDMKATARNIVVEPGGLLAHFDEQLATKGLGPARGSGVVGLRDGAWKVVHYNLSVTVPNERFGAVRALLAQTEVLDRGEDAPSLAPASWLAGSWVGTATDGDRIEEHWSHPGDGRMVGMGRAFRTQPDGARTAGGNPSPPAKSDQAESFEFLRIESRAGGALVYVAQPRGGKPVEFTRKPGAEDAVLVFENLKHDYPKRLTYRRLEGDAVEVLVEGDAKQPKETFRLARTTLVGSKR